MTSYVIPNKNMNIDQLRVYYQQAKKLNSPGINEDLDLIFSIAINNPDRFPVIKGVNNPQSYIERWMKRYAKASKNLPSLRIAHPKSACTDPAIAVIVQTTQNITVQQTLNKEKNHNLFMSAENIQGNLLEEYIANQIRPYGFLWCVGNVLRAIDFCTTDGKFFLQVKNKSNTENSSSSTIREGTKIVKWYRLSTKTKKNQQLPDYKWEILNKLVNANKTQGNSLPACNMSEEDYEAFLKKVATVNPKLITPQ